MGRLYHPKYTRAIPPGFTVRTIRGRRVVELTIRGQKVVCEVKEIKDRLRAIVVLQDRWAIEWTDENGDTRSRTVGKDKRAATAALARYEEQAARLRHGLPDHTADAQSRARPLVGLVDEYLTVLAAGDTSPAYRENTRTMLLAILPGCRWQVWGDVSSASLIKFLGRLRDTPPRGLSPSTLNGYLRTAKAFCNWHAASLRERSPLTGIKPYPEDRDRRRSRRILTDEEFVKLLDATARAPRRFNCIIKPADRVMLYWVAAYSGLRASELARLTPRNLTLDAEQPGITVYGKGKREEFTPIPEHLAERLREWIAGKKVTDRLWPGTWAEYRHQVKWLERDTERAGLGLGVTFHSLRRRYVTQLFRAGNEPDAVRRMARHKDIRTTMNHYAELTPADLKRAAESLKPPG
jgi:integrase/recombinase XerD